MTTNSAVWRRGSHVFLYECINISEGIVASIISYRDCGINRTLRNDSAHVLEKETSHYVNQTFVLSVFCFVPGAGKRTKTKLKLPLCTQQKSIWGSEDNAPRILQLNIVRSWIVRFTPYWARYIVRRRVCGLQNRSGFCEKMKISCPWLPINNNLL